jgi:hypothetical protein
VDKIEADTVIIRLRRPTKRKEGAYLHVSSYFIEKGDFDEYERLSWIRKESRKDECFSTLSEVASLVIDTKSRLDYSSDRLVAYDAQYASTSVG